MDQLLSRRGDPRLALSRSDHPRLAVRFPRGKKMRTFQSLMDEIGAALQFPLYFGENWNALDECLADLSWLPAEGYSFIIADAHEVLSEEGLEHFSAFLVLLERIGREWSSPIDLGQPRDRPGLAFHAVLHAEPGDPRLGGYAQDVNKENAQYDNAEERRVITGPEVKAAGRLGDSTRTDHKFRPVRVPTYSDRPEVEKR